AREARRTRPCDSVDTAIGADFADRIVEGVRDIDGAAGVHGNSLRVVHRSLQGAEAVSKVAGIAIAGDGVDQAVGRDSADARVAAIGDQQISGGIHGDALRRVELSLYGGP